MRKSTLISLYVLHMERESGCGSPLAQLRLEAGGNSCVQTEKISQPASKAV